MKTFPIILLAIFSGILNGSYAVPIKLTRKWEWENIWLWFAISGLLLVPWIFVFLVIPDVGKVLTGSPVGSTVMTFLCGLGWGIGSVAFGLALHLIGFSLGYTLMMGLIAVIGALVPLLVKNPSALVSAGGILILLALLLTVVGIILCGAAGKARENNNTQNSEQYAASKSKFRKGLILCFISGFFSSMLNFAFEFGTHLKEAALSQLGTGSNAFYGSSVTWAVALSGGFLAFIIYAIYLLAKNHTISNFLLKSTRTYFFWTFLMGIIFYGSLLCYGLAASALGNSGTTTGWLIFTAGAIITANIWGVITSEWSGVPMKEMKKMVIGSCLLIGAVFLVSYGNRLL
jgi:L-rhamnose-H+ transport protein